MKRLFVITAMFLASSVWSDMDRICYVFIDNESGNNSYFGIAEYIWKHCERNNIVQFIGATNDDEAFNLADEGEKPYYINIPYGDLIASWCRFDRNVNDSLEEDTRNISCVLYSSQERKIINKP